MISSVGSINYSPGQYSNGVSAASIQSQITRFKQELADCVNCPSSKSLEGKAKIQELTNKISAAEMRLQEISISKSSAQPEKLKEEIEIDKAKGLEEELDKLNNKSDKGIFESLNITEPRLGVNLDTYA